jgi:hypothetical protein
MIEGENTELVIPEKPILNEDELLDLKYRTTNNLELEGTLKEKVEAGEVYAAFVKEHPEMFNGSQGGGEGAEGNDDGEGGEGEGAEGDEGGDADKDKNSNNEPTVKMPDSLSAMLKDLGIEEFTDDVVTKIKTKFKEADELPAMRDALTKTRELLSVKPEEKYDLEIIELNEFKRKFNLPVKVAASLLSEIKSYDPLKDGATAALMIQFKMDNPDYKGSEELLQDHIESIYEIDATNTNDKFLSIKQAKLTSDGNKAIAKINEVKSVLANKPQAADLEALLSNQKATWKPIVEAIINAKDGIPSINFEREGEKYSIPISKEDVVAMQDDILEAVRGMDVKDQKSINEAYKIIQGKYVLNNVAKIIHEMAKGLKTAHAKEVEALNKAKEKAVADKEKEVNKKYVKYQTRDAQGRIINPVVPGKLTNEQIAINRHLESKGQKPYYITGKEPWKQF